MLRRAFLAIALGSMLLGCGADPLIGTWRNTITVLGQPLVSDNTFRADHTVDMSSSFTYAGSSPMYGGCTEVHRIRGAGWSTSTMSGSATMTLTISQPMTIMNTVARSGCVHPADNLAETPESSSAVGMSSSATYTYTINGDTLTWTPTSNGMPADSTTFMRVMSL